MKRWIVSILIFAMLLSAASIPAYAAGGTKTYNTLDDIPEDLEMFKTIATGTISAVKSGSTWYYQFTRKGQTTVRIKAAAFMTTPKNTNLAKDNQVLQSNLKQNSNHNYDRICYYSVMDSKKNKNYTTYSTSMYRLRLEVGGANSEFLTKCELTHCVNFTYSSKVVRRLQDYDAKGTITASTNQYVTPSTAIQYRDALQRTSTVKQIIPTTTVSVTNTGNNKVYLSRYSVCGWGNASTSASGVKGLIDVVYSTISLGKSVTTAIVTPNFFSVSGAFKSIADTNMGKLSLKSNQYNTGSSIALSKNKQYVYKVAYTSPIKLSKNGDWTQVETKCNTTISNAKFHVAFSFTTK